MVVAATWLQLHAGQKHKGMARMLGASKVTTQFATLTGSAEILLQGQCARCTDTYVVARSLCALQVGL